MHCNLMRQDTRRPRRYEHGRHEDDDDVGMCVCVFVFLYVGGAPDESVMLIKLTSNTKQGYFTYIRI